MVYQKHHSADIVNAYICGRKFEIKAWVDSVFRMTSHTN